jgi:RNA polymerase sigma factor (sigma-70 family)
MWQNIDPGNLDSSLPLADLNEIVEAMEGRGSERLVEAAGALLPGYLARFGAAVPADPTARASYVIRLGYALGYHWRKAGLPTLEEAILRVCGSRLPGLKPGVDTLFEIALAEGVCQRHPEAMAFFAVHYGSEIERMNRQVGGVRAAQELEGLVSEIVLNPGRYLKGFKGRAHLGAWLRCIVRTAWMSANRDAQRYNHALEALKHAARPHGIVTESDVADAKDDIGDLSDTLFQRALGVLSAKEAAMLRLNFLEGVTQVAIARVEEVDKSTINRRIQAALAKVRERLDALIAESGRETELREYIERLLWFMGD